MRVRMLHPGGHRDLTITVHDAHATVVDLARALAPGRRTDSLCVDGRRVPMGERLTRAGIADGALLSLDELTGADVGGRARDAGVVAEAVVVDGFDAGHRFALTAGIHVLGRAGVPALDTSTDAGTRLEVADPTVSRHHVRLVVDRGGRATVGTHLPPLHAKRARVGTHRDRECYGP